MDQVSGEDRANPMELLAQADGLRDQRMWDAAAAAYGAYLRLRPEDWRVRVQLGHCVKESGDPAGALAIYRQAESRAPNSADVHLQIGHTLKMLGEMQEAWREFARALELDPELEAAQREVSNLAHLAQPATRRGRQPGQPLQLVFDASDLISWFGGNRAPTGIQRVQLNIIARALLDPLDGVVPAVCAFDPAAGFWREIGRDLFLKLWRLSRAGADIEAPGWVEAMDETRAAIAKGPDFAFVQGATLLNLGTSWWIKDYFLRIRHVQRRFGVRYVPFVHDCIPLLVPEHCSAELVQEFAQWFASLAAHADAVLANSECTANDLREQIRRVLPGMELPVAVIRLDADPRQDSTADARFIPSRSDLPGADEPFVLSVGTIESRKNHLLLFQAWLALIRKHGAAAVPRLVCVGKPGWLADAALALHASVPALREKISIVHGIADITLASLYSRAMFTVYNSFYEGWGLPVTESLGYGKLPLVARHSALVESGGEAALYFEPQNLPDLLAKLEMLIFDAGQRAALEARLPGLVKLRSWGEIADQVMQAVRAGEAAAATPPARRALVRAGAVHPLRLTGLEQPSLDMAMADLVRDGQGWHALERWGCWTRPGIARLRLPLPEGAGALRLRLYLGLVAPPVDVEIGLRVLPAQGATPPFVRMAADAGAAFTCVLEVPPPGEAVELEIDGGEGVRLGTLAKPDQRLVGIGLTSFMLCREEDLSARIAFLERQQLRIIEARPA